MSITGTALYIYDCSMNKNLSDDELMQRLESRFGQLDAERNRFLPRWQEVQRYVSPKTYDWYNLDAIPEIPRRFCSDPCNYMKTLASGLAGYSLSPNIDWFKLSLENQDLLSLYGVKDWLENVETALLAEFNRSNLYQQAINFIQDGVTIGHSVMLESEDLQRNRLRFSHIPCNQIYLDADEYGDIDTLYRRYLMTVRNAVDFFGVENMNETVRGDYGDVQKWNQKLEILCCVYPRDKYNPKYPDAKNMPYACVYIDRTHRHVIKESGYREFPYIVFEWDLLSGLAYSDSAAINALPSIKQLEIQTETGLKIAQKSAEPPMKVSDELRELSLVPNGLNYIKNKDEIIESIKTGENYPITLQVTQDTKQSIKNWFYVDFFLMLEQKEGQMTATEVMELQGEKAATLSSVIVSLNEALKQIITRSFNLLMAAGRLPLPPETLSGQSATMKVVYSGPLAQAQKKYHTSGGIASALQIAAPILQLSPQSGDYIDGDELIKRALEGQGMPQAVIREDEDVKNIRKARAQAQQQAAQEAQQQAQAQTIMQNAEKMNKKIEKGSVLDDMNQQLAGSMQNGQS